MAYKPNVNTILQLYTSSVLKDQSINGYLLSRTLTLSNLKFSTGILISQDLQLQFPDLSEIGSKLYLDYASRKIQLLANARYWVKRCLEKFHAFSLVYFSVHVSACSLMADDNSQKNGKVYYKPLPEAAYIFCNVSRKYHRSQCSKYR